MDEGLIGSSELRRRNVPKANYYDEKKNKQNFNKTIKSLDFFNKRDYKATEKTTVGAALSWIIILSLIVLFLSETLNYLKVRRKDSLSVDLKLEERMNIFFNITFPNIQCQNLQIDTVDASGESSINIAFNMFKQPFDGSKIISIGRKHEVNQYSSKKYNPRDDPHSTEYCGTCYDPALKNECCNSCEQVILQLRKFHRSVPERTEIKQCVHEIAILNPGCNMYGVLHVQKVTGNFHFAPGRSFSQESGTGVHHIHEIDPSLVEKFNATHFIHEIRFGNYEPVIDYPLNDVKKYDELLTLHKYFIKVVPTTIYYPFSTKEAYQMSFTEHVHKFDKHDHIKMPSLFFIYDFSPIRITYEFYRIPFTHFLVKLCAIIGGVFTVSKFFDKLLESSLEKVLSKKFD